MARKYPAARESKSSRTGICAVSFVIVMTPTLWAKAAQGKVHFYGRNMGQRTRGRRGPAPGPVRSRVRAGLEGALRDAIRAGRLRPGTRLPSSRALAADLGIARNTVAEVYSQLVAEGWLTAQTGSGTAVAPHRTPAPGAAVTARAEQAVPRYDLRAGAPDLSAFPRRAWLATARKVLASAPDHLLGYPDPRGVPQLRAALADYLARARGVTADPAHIVICAGFAHGLAGISRALRATGSAALAVEAYGHQAHRDIAAGQGLRLRPIPVDGMGAVVAQAAGADAMLLTPAH